MANRPGAGARPGQVREVALRAPLAYFFASRVPTRRQKAGWLLGYVLPVLALAVAAQGSAGALLPAALMMVAVYAAYGYGYLVNDTVAVQHEDQPTLRLPEADRAWVVQRLGQAFWWRALAGAACVGAIVALRGADGWPAAAGWLLIWPLFALYNHWRGRFTIVLYFGLVTLRFGLPILAAANPTDVVAAWPLLFLYALPITLEAASKPRYGLTRLQRLVSQVHRFRMTWFALLSAAALAYATWAPSLPAWLFAAAAVYYLAFRVGAFVLQRLADDGDTAVDAESASPWAWASARDAADQVLQAVRVALQQVVPLRWTLAALVGAVGLIFAVLFALGAATGTPMALLTRDMAATTGAKFYIGALSNLGALLWSAAASVSLFGAMALAGRPGQRDRAGFLLGAGVLLAALGADDFFMLHEVVYPKLGLDEEWLVLGYGGGLMALLWRYRLVVLDSQVLLVTLGALLFVASVLVDGFVRDATALEDLFKFAGLCFWLVYFWRLALHGLRQDAARR